MNPPLSCPKCGALLPADAPEGLCPACLLSGAFPSEAGTVKLTPSQKPSAHEPSPTPKPEELAPLFPQLEILELLGRGGMGAVYMARQKNLNRLVALKILPIEAGADEHFAERFQREAQALAKLNHPNIVSVFDFGESNGLYFFLMEYVDGANLRTLIRSGEMKPEAALALIPAFCDALQYAHDEGVVHRDIKPENVLVDKKGRVKIADFGLAKLLGHDTHDHTLTRTGMYLGTPRYMAPEQMDKPETVDHRADIYSLGVVFYEMLTGEIPMGRFAPPSEKVQVDVRFDEIVLHALERDVERRYQHASDVRDDVERVTSRPQVAPAARSGTPVTPITAPEPEAHAIGRFLRAILWLLVFVGAVMFIWFEKVTYFPMPGVDETLIRIGAVQPWLVIGDRLTSYAPNFLTVSGLAGIGALIAGIALTCFRRRTRGGASVTAPAVWLIIGAVASLIMTLSLAPETWHNYTKGHFNGTGAAIRFATLAVFAALAVTTLHGALRMLASEDYAASRRAALCSIFSNFGIITLPAGIWALVRLNRPEVKALFPKPEASESNRAGAPSTKPPTRHLLSACLVLLCLFGLFFGFSFQAKTGGTAAGVTKIITVGALDPLYSSESGPSGFQTGINFLSWSFFAVVVSGIAFGALWRIGREDQGKVPRDPAWWRDWWKHVGVWGGLLLIACIVRTVMNPEKVLQPPGDRSVASRFTKLFSSGPEFREDPSRIPTTRTPGRTDYAYAFTVPANHRVFVWLEWWKDGKRTIDQNFNTGYVAKPGQRYDAGVQLVFTDGNIAGPTTAGQKRMDWIFYDPAGHADSGEWRPDFFAGMMTTVSWGEKSSWSPKAGETVTLLEIAGGKDSVLSGPLTDEHLRAGRWQAAMLLKARVEPVPEARPWTAPMTKMNAWNDNQEPTPALLRLGEQFGAVLNPFTDARNLREQIAYRIKGNADARAKAEAMLRDAGLSMTPDEKPEALTKRLEGIERPTP